MGGWKWWWLEAQGVLETGWQWKPNPFTYGRVFPEHAPIYVVYMKDGNRKPLIPLRFSWKRGVVIGNGSKSAFPFEINALSCFPPSRALAIANWQRGNWQRNRASPALVSNAWKRGNGAVMSIILPSRRRRERTARHRGRTVPSARPATCLPWPRKPSPSPTPVAGC